MKKIITLIFGIFIIGLGVLFFKPQLINNFLPQKHTETSVFLNDKPNLVVEACNLSGTRQPNKVVDVGYKYRQYYAYTNENSQLVKVTAENLNLQNKSETLSTGRYCKDEAKVKGTEKPNLDEGHIIADSLGGVSNAYNITPQDSFLNRKGKQYQMEDELRKAIVSNKAVKNFVATITYPNSTTTIPSHYHYEMKISNDHKVYDFDNK